MQDYINDSNDSLLRLQLTLPADADNLPAVENELRARGFALNWRTVPREQTTAALTNSQSNESRAELWVCTLCGTTATLDIQRERFGRAIGTIVSAAFIGLAATAISSAAQRGLYCPRCAGAGRLIPADTPIGRKLLQDTGQLEQRGGEDLHTRGLTGR